MALSLLRCVVVLSFSCMVSLSQVEWDLRLRWSWIVSLCLIRVLVGTTHHQSVFNLSLQLLFHLLVCIRLLCRIKNAHCFEVEGAHRSHKYFLQVFLHHMPVPIHCVLVLLCLSQLVSQGLNLLLVCGTNLLQLHLYSLIKLLFVSLYFSWFKLFAPCLKNSSQVFNPVFLLLVLEDQTSVLLKLTVTLQCKKAAHLCNSESCYCKTFSRPKSHNLASKRVFVTHLCFLSKLLLEVFDLILLCTEQSVASSLLSINRLLLLVLQSALCFYKLLHCFLSKT